MVSLIYKVSVPIYYVKYQNMFCNRLRYEFKFDIF